jgi:hypothetical protein
MGLKNLNDTFTAIYQIANGIDEHNLHRVYDKIISFADEHAGKTDYLVPYRPGKRA